MKSKHKYLLTYGPPANYLSQCEFPRVSAPVCGPSVTASLLGIPPMAGVFRSGKHTEVRNKTPVHWPVVDTGQSHVKFVLLG